MKSQDGNWDLKCFQFATAPRSGEVMLASVAAPSTAAVAFRAAMNSNSPVSFRLTGFGECGRLSGQGNYHAATHRLEYGMLHVVVWAKPDHGFLPNISEESVWQMLRKEHTTPLKREWMPFLMRRLRESRMIQDCRSFGCQCGVLFLDTDSLDGIVSKGLRGKEIAI